MACQLRRTWPLLLASSLPVLVGCGQDTPSLPKGAGTTAEVMFPESDPPVLTRGNADRIQPGMSWEEVIGTLQDAARDTPAAKSQLEPVAALGKLNSLRYDLTVAQGKRKLVLRFRDGKLAEKTQEGLGEKAAEPTAPPGRPRE
jgi:hypothetical protein